MVFDQRAPGLEETDDIQGGGLAQIVACDHGNCVHTPRGELHDVANCPLPGASRADEYSDAANLFRNTDAAAPISRPRSWRGACTPPR